MRIVIFGNGSIKDTAFIKNIAEETDFVICCDGGANNAYEAGICPDLILGDMDSIAADILTHYRAEGVQFEKYPAEKDYTDMELGILKAVEMNPSEIVVLGGIGSRIDHTIGNAQALLYCLKTGIKSYLMDENNSICIIDKYIELEKGQYDVVSLIPLTTRVTGITTDGLYYPLAGETLEIGTSRGISNRFTASKASVTIESGYLFVICAKD